MSDEPKYFDDKNKQLWEAVDEYFAKAGTDSFENMWLIRSAIDRLGEAIIITGFSWVAERIEHEGYDSVRLAAYGSPGELLDLRLFMLTDLIVSQLRDVIRTTGVKAGSWLVAGVSTTPDEDEQALNALLLVDFISTLEPLPLEMAKSLLKSYYDLAESTSCKMAIAWALYNLGQKKLWEDLVYGDYFLKSEFVQRAETMMKIFNPTLNQTEIKDLICRMFATGDYPEQLPVPEPSKRSVLRVLALDIASNGAAFSHAPKWSRKPKK